jgi:hypothetical protein
MQAMQRSLQHLLACCAGDERPECPILDDLAGQAAEAAPAARTPGLMQIMFKIPCGVSIQTVSFLSFPEPA